MKHVNLTPALYDYMLDVSLRDDPVLAALRKETASLPLALMQVAPEQAQFMQLLIRLIHATNVLELGTYTGYSALAMAMALPENGRLITCDINHDSTRIARDYWKQAKQDHKIELRLGPALTTLQQMINDGLSHTMDFIFIDADKTNYVAYYELALQLVTPRGLIAIDNVFWDGDVINNDDTRAQTREIRRLNEHIKHDNRVHISLLPIADGLFLVQLK